MNLTPIDVEQKAFTQALRGYQMDEVDDFLDEVVATLRSYEQRLREAQDKIRALESDTSSRGGDESEISRAIITAQRSADRLLTEAKAEAEAIRGQAEADTAAAIRRRDEEKDRLQGEVSGMRDLVGSLRAKLSELATAVTSEIDQMEDNLSQTVSTLDSSGGNDSDTTEIEDAKVDSAAGDTPTFSDIFPAQAEAREVDITDEVFEPEPEIARVSSRPWERG
ncbi:MAG TPA: DivIVA domain-containing protein [Acidimicrobiia bacterium]|nr:DivIVA domain-containing protein [Acidimicrobiia bacterium]